MTFVRSWTSGLRVNGYLSQLLFFGLLYFTKASAVVLVFDGSDVLLLLLKVSLLLSLFGYNAAIVVIVTSVKRWRWLAYN